MFTFGLVAALFLGLPALFLLLATGLLTYDQWQRRYEPSDVEKDAELNKHFYRHEAARRDDRGHRRTERHSAA